jgi:taurine--2-oxoglutarate transaminase
MASEARAKIGPLLASHTPGDLNKFFFTLGGAEANENAIKLARQFTGRQKIITRYRSYHGATAGAISLTGDYRRWANEPGMPGVVRVFDPYRYRCAFCKNNPAGCTMDCLNHIEEVIQYEGPHTIAAVFIETVTGTNGLIVPPDGYLQGLRQLCDKYGILLVCDEVMAGFGRTGEWFAVDHWNVVPDLLTMAKGLTSSYLPLGCAAMSDKIADYFGKNVYYGGLTYNAHPLSLAAAIATIEVMEEEDIVGHAQRMGQVMAALHDDLKAEHPAVGDVRSIGLFGVLELVKNRETKEPLPAADMAGVSAYLKEHGLYHFAPGNLLFTNPPLIITEPELKEAFEIINQALAIADQAVK